MAFDVDVTRLFYLKVTAAKKTDQGKSNNHRSSFVQLRYIIHRFWGGEFILFISFAPAVASSLFPSPSLDVTHTRGH